MTDSAALYRVQASDGRGPWRPGLSQHWVDENRTKRQASILEAFGTSFLSKIPQGWHAGCACRTLEGLMGWFTKPERERLAAMGYSPVAIYPDKIIEENEDQVVFACKMPLMVCALILPWTFAADSKTHELETQR